MPNPKAPEGAIAIPEPYREVYDDVCNGTRTQPAYVKKLIYRIASLTQRAELAESRVKELSKPVQSEEAARYSRHVNGRLMIPVRDVDALVAARVASAAPDGAPVGGKEGER